MIEKREEEEEEEEEEGESDGCNGDDQTRLSRETAGDARDSVFGDRLFWNEGEPRVEDRCHPGSSEDMITLRRNRASRRTKSRG